MTYDENEDYNGPDVHRRGPFLFMAALVGVILVAGFGAAVSDARADPNTQTVLPADGVLSITRAGDVWSVTTDGIPSEVKLLSPRNEVLCGVNYGIPCTTLTTFTSNGECAFIQVDGLPGFNSSDPFLCLGGTPSATPTLPAPTPDSTGTPTPSPSTPPTSTAEPSPTPSPTPTSYPTSTPELSPSSSSIPVVDSPTSPTPSGTSSVDTMAATPTFVSQRVPARLADTGADATPTLTVFAVITLLFGASILWGRRKGLEQYGSEK